MVKKVQKEQKKDEFSEKADVIKKQVDKLKSNFKKEAEKYSDLELIMHLAQDKATHIDRAGNQSVIFTEYKHIIEEKKKYMETADDKIDNSKIRKFNSEIKAKKDYLFKNFEEAAMLAAKIEANHKELEKRIGFDFEFENNGYMMSYISLLLLSKQKEFRIGA